MDGKTEWISLGAWTQALRVEGDVLALTFMDYSGQYTTRTGEEAAAYEFWWAPLADLTAREVLFGLGGWEPGDSEWEDAWSRARAATEMLYAEYIGEH